MRAGYAVVASAVLAAGVALADRRSIAGAVVVLAFLVLAPGTAIVRLARLGERGAARLAIVVAASLAFDVVVTEFMLYAHVWTAVRGVVVLAAFAVVLVAIERTLRRAHPEVHRP